MKDTEPTEECLPIGDLGGLAECECAPSEGKRVAVVLGGKGGKKVVLKGLDVEGLHEALQGRGNIVMTRVRDADLERIDALVHAGLFDSRSEAAAFLIQQGIAAQKELFGKVKETAAKIKDLRDKMRKEISG